MNRPEINSEWTSKARPSEQYKVVGFKTIHNGRTGVETVRYIKSRNDWAKTPVCFSYLDPGHDGENEVTWDLFHNMFQKS